MSPTDRLDPDKIKAGLKTKIVGSKILVYNETASTNQLAAEYAKKSANAGMVIFTEHQTAGKGRGKNKWISGKYDSIICSFIVENTEAIEPELLSLAVSVAVAKTIGDNAGIKWPNDILIDGKKIAGILIESKTYTDHSSFIIGIGINCHQKNPDFPAELQKKATSLDIQTKIITDRTYLAKRLITEIDKWLEKAQKSEKKIIEQWQKKSILLGHRIAIIYKGKKFIGNCIGIDPKKGLIMQLELGSVKFFEAAHTSISQD